VLRRPHGADGSREARSVIKSENEGPAPDCAEPVIGRRFAPTRWLHPGYSHCAACWVVLSACNTAGGEASNSEAFSGLARAFFYAGTRALLVSHWPALASAAALSYRLPILDGSIFQRRWRWAAISHSLSD